MRRNHTPALILGVEAIIVAGCAIALRSKSFPLGVRGEWEWLRVPVSPEPIRLLIAAVGLSLYALLVSLIFRWLSTRATFAREVLSVGFLLVMAVLVQGVAHLGAPVGYGLEKWVVALHQKGSSGYFTIAKAEAYDTPRFLKDYPVWIQKQDALHLGTHPPGLIVLQAFLIHRLEECPPLCRLILDLAPDDVTTMLRVFGSTNPMTATDRATLVLTGELTLLACSTTLVPLYWLARKNLPASMAFATAAFWPLVPSAILFQPTADTAFPLLTTLGFAFALRALDGSRTRLIGLGIACGIVLGIGMQLTLAFLAVGLIVALVVLFDREARFSQRVTLLVTIGAAFLGITILSWWVTGANPFLIWWWNQANHARFYTEFPRSYWAWVVANPIELAIGLGLPFALWAVIGLCRPKSLPRLSVATLAVLIFLTIGGRSLSEVGRLWIPFMPALLVATGHGMQCLGAGPRTVGATIALVAVQILVLEATIQVVYPI